jgi:GT2 family glycosyltransferase
MPAPTVSIIIPTFDRRERIRRHLERLGRCDHMAETEVIVVDQSPGAGEPLAEISTSSPPFNVRWLFLDYPNVSAARNAGGAIAAGTILLFLDDDVELERTYISRLMELMGSDTADVLGGTYVTEFDDDCSGGSIEFVEWLPAGNIALRRRDFVAVGGFDENIYRYNEDAEFSHRLRRRGLTLARHALLQAIHHHRPEGGTWHGRPLVLRTAREVMKNDLYFLHAVGGGLGVLVLAACRNIKWAARGSGKICGGRMMTRIAACCLSLPGAFVYAFRAPKLLDVKYQQRD